MGRLLLILALAAGFASAQRQVTVAQLETFIRSAIQLKQRDNQVADTLKSLQLTERLTVAKIEDLQGAGAGERTLAQLREMARLSAALPAAAPPAPVATAPSIPPPSAEEFRAFLAEVRKNALDYTAGLPNFICTQVTRRYYDAGITGSTRLADTIVEQLSFVDKKESYKVVMVNNLPVNNIDRHTLGGVTSSGEFGTQLFQIFKPETQTDFYFDQWTTLRGRRTIRIGFTVAQARSEYSVYDGESGRSIVTGYHGLVYADRDTKQVMRILMEADSLAGFPINQLSIDLNYAFSEISGQQYVLPLKAVLKSRSGRQGFTNDVEFRRYQKFSADATIVFDVDEQIPEDQLKDQPVQ